uniref:Homeobox domain-containing protein n=1 Tax=Oryza barthii TaxID=65489 RepID=A0A0D3HGM2_9ORYZ
MEMMVHGRRDEQYGGLGLGLGLGLSLGVAGGAADDEQPPPRRGAAPPPQQQLCGWNGGGLFSSSSSDHRGRSAMMACHDVIEMPFLRGIDVNRAPAAETTTTTARGPSCSEEDEEPGASSPNSTLSSLSGKRGAPSAATAAAAASDDEDSGGGSRKKLRLSKDQAAVLEDTFKEHNTLNPKQKAALARQLNLKPRQVEVWFQNRRARTKLKQTEVDCELLKRCCETLTDENRRLHRELQVRRRAHVLRAQVPDVLRQERAAVEVEPRPERRRDGLATAAAAPHHLYGARVPPPTTLTMCPSCERVASAATTTRNNSGAAPARPVPTRPWPPAAAQRSSA